MIISRKRRSCYTTKIKILVVRLCTRTVAIPGKLIPLWAFLVDWMELYFSLGCSDIGSSLSTCFCEICSCLMNKSRIRFQETSYQDFGLYLYCSLFLGLYFDLTKLAAIYVRFLLVLGFLLNLDLAVDIYEHLAINPHRQTATAAIPSSSKMCAHYSAARLRPLA